VKPLNNLFADFPYSGVFRRWDSDRGFGFIESKTLPQEHFAHITTRDGSTGRNLDLRGKKCVFATGYTPRRRDKLSVVKWILDEDVDGDIETYDTARTEAIQSWSSAQVLTAAEAKWYTNGIWRGEQTYPKVPRDNILHERIQEIIANSNDQIEAIRIIQALGSSPYYCSTELEKDNYLSESLQAFAKSHAGVFVKSSYDNIFKFLKSIEPKFHKFFNPYLQEASLSRVLVLDIESDGEKLFQIGYTYDHKVKFVDFTAGSGINETDELQNLAAISESRWLVGHNLIGWDLPTLRKLSNDPHYLENPIWDTLYISTLLAPWKPLHALSSSAKAHQADADAEATYELFKEQVEYFDLDSNKFFAPKADFSLVEFFHRLNQDLQSSEKLSFPAIPSWLTKKIDQDLESLKFVIPEAYLEQCFWVPELVYEWPDGYLNADHYFLTSKAIKTYLELNVSVSPNDLLLSSIVENAEFFEIQVLVAMIPWWLRQKTSLMIGSVAKPHKPDAATGKSKSEPIRVFTYESASSSEDPKAQEFSGITQLFPELKSWAFLKELDGFSLDEISSILEYSTSSEEHYLLQPLTHNEIRALLPNEHMRGNYWIEFLPGQKTKAKPYTLFHSLYPVAIWNESKPTNTELSDLFIRPKWFSEETGGPLPTDAIWPTTDNRIAYWREVLERFVSLRGSTPTETLLVLLVSDHQEKTILNDILNTYGLSLAGGDTVIRQIVASKKQDVGSCSIDVVENIHAWLYAAEETQIDIQFVLESIPLSKWAMCIDIPELHNEHGFADEEDQPSDEESSHDSERDELTRGLTSDQIEACYQYFLGPWLKSTFHDAIPIILDPRVNFNTKHVRKLGIVKEFGLLPLSDEQMEVLNHFADDLGTIIRTEAPRDYNSYEEFLQKHWGFKQFKPNTQKPAIDAICESEGDLLVKLPTGEGKSVIFQVPALLRGLNTKKLTIVITPLKALMRDQVASLWRKGFLTSVDYLSGDREYWESSEVYQGILDNRIKLLYVAPERFRVQRFRNSLNRRYQNDHGLEFVVVDETHCISQWGFEFRPDYFYAIDEINRLYRSAQDPVRVLMFSATVTRAVEDDLRILLSDSTDREFIVEPEIYSHPIQSFISITPEEVPVGLYGRGQAEKVSSRAGEIAELIKEANPDVNKSVVLVFVTRRTHAEQLTEHLTKELPDTYNIDYFHAGLPPSERLRVYDSVKASAEGGTNVLIATKAFGMGMDIPNIHWCIHLAPPSYLEDYLQEVGRTGRGEVQRKEVGLDRIVCTLLHNAEDFSTNHELVRRGMLKPPDLRMLWDTLIERSSDTGTGNRIVVLSQDSYTELNSNSLKLALSWLERKPSLRLSILGFVPDMLKISIRRDILTEAAKNSTDDGLVANAILKIYTAADQKSMPGNSNLSQGGIWDFLGKFVGFIFNKPSSNSELDDSTSEILPDLDHTEVQAEIHLSAVLHEAKLTRTDDLYRALFSLQDSRAISIERNIEFKAGTNADQSEVIWRWVEALLADLAAKPFDGVRELLPEDIMAVVYEIEDPASATDQKRRARIESVVRATISLLNKSGVKIRENLNTVNDLVFSYRLTNSKIHLIKWKLKRYIEIAKALQVMIRRKIDSPINLGDFLRLLESDRSLKEIEIALKLLSDLGLYKSQQRLFSYSYLLELLDESPLYEPGHKDINDKDVQMFADLEKVNRFAELRSFSMELFSRLSDPDLRVKFIDEYFQADTHESLEAVIARSIGDIDNPDTSEALIEIQRKVRQEAITESLDQLKEGPEPEQYNVCVHPWHRNMLVNAGPGAGKTHVLMLRAAHLIHQQGLRPEQVLILAFNRAVVHEIRSRVKALFDRLGYGAYVRRLNVRTFHSFAIEHMPEYQNMRKADVALDELVENFCDKCRYDEEFAKNTIAGIRVILVDEFQDMNDSRYEMLKSLYQAAISGTNQTNLGLMVIGDDDQDILRWNRTDNPVEGSYYFNQFKTDFEPIDEFTLKINFRSDSSIVERTQRFLENVLHPVSPRLKHGVSLFSKPAAASGDIIDNFDGSLDSLLTTITTCREEQRSCAILTRTNYEASLLYHQLLDHFTDVHLQGQQNLKVSRLRHVGEWLDACKQAMDREGDIVLTEEVKKQIDKEYAVLNSSKLDAGNDVKIDFLIDAVFEENPSATLSSLINFIEDIEIDEYIRIYGSSKLPKWREQRESSSTSRLVISTINKIKGLEYDTIIIMPSTAEFPFAARNKTEIISLSQADECRLYYVAMTRAEKHLMFTVGTRERSWMSGVPYQGSRSGVLFQGSPEEIFLTWPGFNDETQDYIKSRIQVGDSVRLAPTTNSLAIQHKEVRIGFVSRSQIRTIGRANGLDLKIHSIYRYPINEDTKPEFLAQLSDSCKKQGWCYTTLISGYSI